IVVGIDSSFDGLDKKTVDKLTRGCMSRSLSWYSSYNQQLATKLIENFAAEENTMTLKKYQQGYPRFVNNMQLHVNELSFNKNT
ncbi:8501_t:CDS:1, partial [Racocetra fulgida]